MTVDLDHIAAEIALMLDPTHYGTDDLPGMTPEIRAARRRISKRYDELKVKLPIMDAARRARAEVVADWLRRRLDRPEAIARAERSPTRVERFAIGTRIDCGDSGEGHITARDGVRVFLESPEYTGWLDEEWLFAQCHPDTKIITLPNGNAVRADQICLVTLCPREDDLPDRVFVSVLGGDSQRIDCESAEEAKRIRDEIIAQVNEATVEGDPA